MERTNMIIENKKLSINGFIDYMKEFKVHRKVKKLVFHHTSSPVETWQGSASMLHYYNLYCSRGWKEGPHIFIEPDGIWLFTNLNKNGKCSNKLASKRAIQIEVVGRYFDVPPMDQDLNEKIALVTQILLEKYHLGYNDIFNHRMFEKHSNCTNAITREWVIDQLNEYAHINNLRRQ